MPYTVYTDANSKYLSDAGDKVAFTSSGDAAPLIESAERIIRARLSGFIDKAYQATWVDTSTTPEIIQEIAAKLAAALQYRRRASEDATETDSYAQTLYNEAIADLQCIVDGDIDITEDGLVLADTANISQLNFYPNDLAIGTEDDVKFSIGMQF